MQFLLYRFMRRHNVSPHEPAGSSGLSGMLVSALTAPIYARSLMKVVLGRKLTFNVTAKGSSASPDRLWTFRYSLMWAVVPIAILAIALTAPPALSDDDGLDRRHPGGLPGARSRSGSSTAPVGAAARSDPRRAPHPAAEASEPNRPLPQVLGDSPMSQMLLLPAARPERRRRQVARRAACWASPLAALMACGVLAANVPTVGAAWRAGITSTRSPGPPTRPSTGCGSSSNIPAKFRVNGIHSTLLYNGDVLIMAGSGNNQAFFNAGHVQDPAA